MSRERVLEDVPAGPSRVAGPRRVAVSDVHGHVDVLAACLVEQGVIDADRSWTGATTRMWFLGDYVDRGRQGLEVIDLVRRLEHEAVGSGGSVKPLLGNHDLQFLAALHFGDRQLTHDRGTTWRAGWLRYGGVEEELCNVDEATVDWLTRLSLLDLDGDDLLLHSDTDAYLRLGGSVDQINAVGREILTNRDPDAWALLHQVLVQRHGFRGPGSPSRVLSQLGGRRVVHGHSSLIGSFGLAIDEARVPYVYASGRALAIDGGVFEGGSIVVAQL